MKLLRSILLTLVAASLLLSGCSTSGGGTGAAPTTGVGDKASKVRFAMDWTPNTNHTGIYVAQEMGWYREVGVEVEILPYSFANTPDTLVGNGKADFGVSFAEGVVTDYANRLPVKSVAAILQTNTSAIVTLKGSGLERPSQLEGKRYAGFGSPYEEPVLQTVLRADGAPTGKFENITTNISALQVLAGKKADFLWIFEGWEGVQAKLEGIELNSFPIKEYGVPDYYTPVIIANTTFLKDNGDVARRFLAATARGYEFGVSNPVKAADLLVGAVPPETFASKELPRNSQKYLAPYYKGDQSRWGRQTLEKWTAYPKFISEAGQVKTSDGVVVRPEDIDYGALFTNEYLP